MGRKARNRLRAMVLIGLLGSLPFMIQSAGADPQASTFATQVITNDGVGEPEVAVDPANSAVIVDAHGSGISVSDDGGHHWREVVVTRSTSSNTGSDPVVVADGPGTFFATTDLFSSLLESTDGGQKWTKVASPLHNPLPVGWSVLDTSVHPASGPLYMGPSVIGCDRPLMGSDPNTGTIYASCSDHGDQSGGEGQSDWEAFFALCRSNVFSSGITTNCGRRYISASHDHGKTWTPWEPEDGAGWPASYTGAFDGIPVGAHGVLATAYVAGAAPGSDCTQCAVFETSTNDGKTWSRHLIPGATPQIASLSSGTSPSSAGSDLAGNDNQTVWFEPYVAADPSRVGRYAVMILDASRTQLLVYQTTDSGLSWTGPAILSNGPYRVDKPAMAYGPSGALGVAWKSVDGPNLSFDVYAAVSPSGTLAFGHPVRLSTRRSSEETCGLGGSEGQAYACDELSWLVMDRTHLDFTWGANIGGENPWFGRYNFTSDPQFKR